MSKSSTKGQSFGTPFTIRGVRGGHKQLFKIAWGYWRTSTKRAKRAFES